MNRRLLSLTALALCLGLASPTLASTYTVTLSGDQQVPANASPATGSGSFTLDGNTLHYEISFGGLSSTETGAHCHGPAGPGTNGGVVFGMGTGSPKVGSYWLSNEQIEMLDAGMYYVNIHSEDYPNGEIRGQITAQPVATDELSFGQAKAEVQR